MTKKHKAASVISHLEHIRPPMVRLGGAIKFTEIMLQLNKSYPTLGMRMGTVRLVFRAPCELYFPKRIGTPHQNRFLTLIFLIFSMVGNLKSVLGRGVSFWSKTLYILVVAGLATIGEVCGLPSGVQWYCMMNRTSSNGFRNERSIPQVYRGPNRNWAL